MAEGLRHKAHRKLGGGLNLSTNRLTLASGEALVAQNCDRDHGDAVRKRKGNEWLWWFNYPFPYGIRYPIVGIYNHEYDYKCRGKRHWHLVVLADGSVWYREKGDGVSFVRVPTATQLGEVLTDYASFVTIGGDTFIAVGSKRLRLFDGDYIWWAGLEAPTTAPTAATNGAGVLDGDYKYQFTYIYRTDETFRESGPSPASTSAVTASSNTLRVTWTPHPNSVSPGNGERCSGYRIYRSIDLSSGAAEGVYLLVDEVSTVTSTTYDDNKPFSELTSLAPLERPIPPDGTKLVAEHSDSLFCFSPRFNRVGLMYSGSKLPEVFPAINSTVIPDSTTSAITGVFKISGNFGCMTEDKIYQIAGSSPRDFVHREMSSYTGCLSPASLQIIDKVAIFVGKHGIYGWDGVTPRLLSEPLQDEVVGLSFDAYRRTCGAVYQELNHYYCSMESASGEKRRVWVYDLASETTRYGNTDLGELDEPRATRAWFEYVGMNMRSVGAVRDYTDRKSLLYWGDDEGRLFLYDRGDTDGFSVTSAVRGAPIRMQYDYVFMPSENKAVNPLDRTFIIRKVILHTDRCIGTFKVGLRYLRSHVPGMFYRPWRTRTQVPGDVREHEERFAHNGSSAAVVSIVHDGPGEFRVVGVSHEWQPRTLRHQEV